MMKTDARPLTVPRAIATTESKAAMTPLTNPITKNLTGWRSRLRGESVTSTNAVIHGKNGKKNIAIPSSSSVIKSPKFFAFD
jgi:hypothetical protein